MPTTQLPTGRVSFVDMLGHTLANITPSAMATVTISLVVAKGGLLTWAVYLIVGLVMLLVATQVATLARIAPAAGSLFVSVSRALHPLAGVLSGWSMMGGYLGALLATPIIGGLFVTKALGVMGISLPWPFVALVFSGLAWALTVRDVGVATRYSLVIEIVSLAVIILIGIVTLAHVGIQDPAQWRAPVSPTPFLQAMTLSILAYGGFETAANFGREGRSPTRDVPLAIISAVVFSILFYVLMAYAEMAGFANKVAVLAHTEAPLSVLAVGEGHPAFAVLSDLAMAIAAFSATIATMNSLGRLLYSMGRHGVLPGALGQIGRHQTPAFALHLLGALTAGFAALAALMEWTPLSIVDLFGVFTALGFIVIYILAMIAVPVLRRRQGLPPSWTAGLAALVAAPLLLYVFGQNFWAATGVARVAAYAFLLYVLAGTWLYAVWQRRVGHGDNSFFGPRDDD